MTKLSSSAEIVDATLHIRYPAARGVAVKISSSWTSTLKVRVFEGGDEGGVRAVCQSASRLCHKGWLM